MQVTRQPEKSAIMQIFDAHAHLFPPRVAERAVSVIGEFYGLQMSGNGLVGDLYVRCRRAGITHSLVCSTATHPGQASSINTFISQVRQDNQGFRQNDPSLPQLIAFGTVYPGKDFTAIRRDVDQVLDLTLSGIKLHPDFQNIAADSDGVVELCRYLDSRVPILIHAGDHRYQTSSPERIAKLARAFPSQRFVAAHFGGWSVWPSVLRHLADLPNISVDTSSSLMIMSSGDAMKLINGFGMERVLFGSDYPACDPSEELTRFMNLPLTETERKTILFENGRLLLSLT